MTNNMLFILAAFFGGTTWIFLPILAQYVVIEHLVTLRYFIAAGVIFALVKFFRKESLRLDAASMRLCFLQGLTLYSLNCILCFHAIHYIVSGLIAVTVSLMVIPNTLLGYFFLKKVPTKRTVVGSLIGLLGVGMLFWKDLITLDPTNAAIIGFLLAFSSTFISAFGTILGGKMKSSSHSVFVMTGWSMFFGAIFSLIYAWLTGAPFAIKEINTEFIFSLLYTSILGTVLIFSVYIKIVRDEGPSKASFLWIAIPPISLVTSSFFEGFTWDLYAVMGVLTIFMGGYICFLMKPKAELPAVKKI